jgi:hypothetical protein
MSVYSSGIGEAVQGVSIDSTRRLYNFGDRVAELAPLESPFFVYGSKLRKEPTDDTVFKFLEQRHQWQRRNFQVQDAVNPVAIVPGVTLTAKLSVLYDKYGRVAATETKPEFLLVGQTLSVRGLLDPDGAGALPAQAVVVRGRITALGASDATQQTVTFKVISISNQPDLAVFAGGTIAIADSAPGQVTGSAFAEATGAPDGWMDALYNREGYTQIFKTSIPLFSGSTLATRYRGRPNEFLRVWTEKLKEHKMDIEQELLFGVGRVEAEDGTEAKRYTWGIVPYTERFGQVFGFTYANSGYDDFIDALKVYMAPELGGTRDKLVLTSRNIIAWLQKLQVNGFLKNTVTANSYKLDVQNVQGQFGHEVTMIKTVFGRLHFVEEPLFRNLYEDYAVCVDMKNVAIRPLVGNGHNRDTFIETNVQAPDIDGRKDLITTELGLQIDLPETHAIMKWS